MHISTSSHILHLGKNHVYDLRKIGVAGDDSWLETRCGEAFDRRLQVKLKDEKLNLYFENQPIGHILLSNYSQCLKLVDFVKNWNLQIGPTDLATVRICELVRNWDKLYKTQTLAVKCVTWNCAGLMASNSLQRDTWHKLLGDELVTSRQDLIVICFQETDNINRSVKSNTQTLKTCTDISQEYLYRHHTLVSSAQLLGLMTLVFVRNPLVPYLSNMHTDTVSTGFLRVWGNKGAILTRFNLFRDETVGNGVEVSIVNCHLSAGEGTEQLQRRQWELSEISTKFNINGLTTLSETPSENKNGWFDEDDSVSSLSSEDEDFTNDDITSSEKNRPYNAASSFNENSTYETPRDSAHINLKNNQEALAEQRSNNLQNDKLFEDNTTDSSKSFNGDTGSKSTSKMNSSKFKLSTKPSKYTVLLGDLNYRVLLTQEEGQEKFDKEKWNTLLAHDSLSLERSKNSVFCGFEEAEINFAPTYKYNIDTCELSTRVPSYTDRILFRTSCPTQVLTYTSNPDLKSSDHRPIIYEASVEINNCIDPTEQSAANAQAMKIVDDAENKARPSLEVDEQQLTLKGPPLSTQYHVLTVKNLGSRPFQFIVENAQAGIDLEDVTSDSKNPPVSKAHMRTISKSPDAAKTTSSAMSSISISSSETSSEKSFQTSLIEKGLFLGNIIEIEKSSDTKPLTDGKDITVTPGSVTFDQKLVRIKLSARVGIKPRNFIALLRAEHAAEGAGQKYVFVKIIPTKSYLGLSLDKLPVESKSQIPIPIHKCVEYLRSQCSIANLSSSLIFLQPAEQSLFQQVLSWLDKDEQFDIECLDCANRTAHGAGCHAVAQVLLAIIRYLPNTLIGSSVSNDNVVVNRVTTYICDFIREIQADDATLDVLADVLYRSSNKDAEKIEKRDELRNILKPKDSEKDLKLV